MSYFIGAAAGKRQVKRKIETDVAPEQDEETDQASDSGGWSPVSDVGTLEEDSDPGTRRRRSQGAGRGGGREGRGRGRGTDHSSFMIKDLVALDLHMAFTWRLIYNYYLQ